MIGPIVLFVSATSLVIFALVFAVTFEARFAAMVLSSIVAVAALILLDENLSEEG